MRFLQRGFFLLAAACLGYCAYTLAESSLYDARERRLESALREGPGPPGPSLVSPGAATTRRRIAAQRGGLIGRLELSRLGLSAAVAEGVDRGTLRRAVGHLPESALPGERGNVVLAGHRDTFFRELRRVRQGDVLRLRTPEGAFEYAVESTAIVDASQTEVLAASEDPTLTLITCYPFYYVGPAPERFVVRARTLSRHRGEPAPSFRLE